MKKKEKSKPYWAEYPTTEQQRKDLVEYVKVCDEETLHSLTFIMKLFK